MNLAANNSKHVRFEVWAQLFLSDIDRDRLRDFFVQKLGVKSKYIVRRMHITVYHSRRPMFGLVSRIEPVSVTLPACETRFMVMAPGGENPRPYLDPSVRKVGIRIHRKSIAMPHILSFREQLLKFETPSILGKRPPSTHRTSAFGARSFQPHMALLRAGSGVPRDLTRLGIPFRQQVGDLHFDRFEIEVVRHDPNLPQIIT